MKTKFDFVKFLKKQNNKKILIIGDNSLNKLKKDLKISNINCNSLDWINIDDLHNVSDLKNFLNQYNIIIISEVKYHNTKYDDLISSILNLKQIKIKINSANITDDEMIEIFREYLNKMPYFTIKDRTVYKGVFIGKYKSNIRRKHNNGRLGKELELIFKGFGETFDKKKYSFDEMLDIIIAYLNETGCSYLDIKQDTIYNGINIGNWKWAQRENFNNNKLTIYKVNSLIMLGEDFAIGKHLSFLEMIKLIKEYLSKTGISYLQISRNTVYKGINIGHFRFVKRSEYNKRILKEEEEQILRELGEDFVINKNKSHQKN